MRIKLNETVEHVHKWVDQESGKVQRLVIRARKGTVLDSEQLECGDPERALQRLVDLGRAEPA